MENIKKIKKGKRRVLTGAVCFILMLCLLAQVSLFADAQRQPSGKLLYAGGIPFGVKFFSRGVVVAGFCDIPASTGSENPAQRAGLQKNDIIISVDGKEPESCEDFLAMIEASRGMALDIVFERNGERKETKLYPVYSGEEGRYRSGLFIRQGGAGIGTVTYIDPQTLSFGGLGHGICDSESGALLPMSHGVVMDVNINGLIKGKNGAPGEIKGSFSSVRRGVVHSNTECGVFGMFSALPKGFVAKEYPISTRSEVKEGKAYILCTLDETGTAGRYEIEISAINRASRDNKSFTIKICDPALIEKSGGIIQGMSGSPIIQNGRLVGAVTHVMISDPTVGYGIFIENMLERAEAS